MLNKSITKPSPRFNHFFRNSYRKLLLPGLNWGRTKDPMISLGQASILANLRKYNVAAIHNSWGVNHHDFAPAKVAEFIMRHSDPQTDVAFGAYIWNEASLQRILNLIRPKFPGRIIMGGPQISYISRS